jgi:DNA polymerase-1
VDCFAADPRPLFPILAEKVLIAHNALFDLGFLSRLGFVPGHVRCTMLQAQLLTAGTREPCTLRACARRELGRDFAKDLQRSDWSRTLSAEQLDYAAADAGVLLPLYWCHDERLSAAGLADVAVIEQRCLPAMLWLSSAGVPIDTDAWRQLTAEAELSCGSRPRSSATRPCSTPTGGVRTCTP